MDGMPRVSSAAQYARIVKDKAILRQLAATARAIEERALNSRAKPAEALHRAAEDLEKLSAAYKLEVVAERTTEFQTGPEIAVQTPSCTDWIAKPWAAAGSVTEVSGKVKLAGKTTWVTHLVRAVLDGAPFLGEPTARTPVVYLTEQPPASFRIALERAGLLDRRDLFVLFRHRTVGAPWAHVARRAVQECKRQGARLLVVDTLAQFAGLVSDAENNAGDALLAMEPLQQAAAADGLSVIVVRHERKSGGAVGDSGRGSSAYAGAADIVLSIRRSEGNSRATLRTIHGVSRFDETPDELVVEFTPEGYVSRGCTQDVARSEAQEAILAASPQSEAEAATLEELLAGTQVKRTTGQKAAQELWAAGRLSRAGNGRKGNPFRYWLPIHSAATPSYLRPNQSARPLV